jgi:molybdenum cofactor guanylyltransferase
MISPDLLSVIVLSGGKSSRMNQDKGLVVFDKSTLIETVIQKFKGFANEIIISSNSSTYDYLGYQVIADEIPEIGPMGGIYSYLPKSKTDYNFVVSCDMVLLEPQIIHGIISRIVDNQVIVGQYAEGFYEPLCAVYHKSVLPIIQNAIGRKDYSLQNLIKCAKSLTINIESQNWNKSNFFSVNSPNDLAFAQNFGTSGINQTKNQLT